MKSAYIMLIVLCYYSAVMAQENDLSKSNLKGFVVSLEEEDLNFIYKFGEIEHNDKPKSFHYLLFNEHGNKIEERYNQETALYTYNEQQQLVKILTGNFKQTYSYYPNGKIKEINDYGDSYWFGIIRGYWNDTTHLTCKRKYTYENGETIISKYNEDGKLFGIDIDTYNQYTENANRGVEYKKAYIKDSKGKIVKKGDYKIGKDEFIIEINEEISYNSKGDTASINEIEFRYEYDQKGNWISCKKYTTYDRLEGEKLVGWKVRKIQYANSKTEVKEILEERKTELKQKREKEEKKAKEKATLQTKIESENRIKKKVDEILRMEEMANYGLTANSVRLYLQRHTFKDSINQFYYIIPENLSNAPKYITINNNGGIGDFSFPENNKMAINNPQYSELTVQYSNDENAILIRTNDGNTVIGIWNKDTYRWGTHKVMPETIVHDKTKNEVFEEIRAENNYLIDKYNYCKENNIEATPSNFLGVPTIKLEAKNTQGVVKDYSIEDMNVSLKLKDKTILPTFKIERIKRIETNDKTNTIVAYYTADKKHIMYFIENDLSLIGLLITNDNHVYELNKKFINYIRKNITAR